jgi:hypothetical protein
VRRGRTYLGGMIFHVCVRMCVIWLVLTMLVGSDAVAYEAFVRNFMDLHGGAPETSAGWDALHAYVQSKHRTVAPRSLRTMVTKILGHAARPGHGGRRANTGPRRADGRSAPRHQRRLVDDGKHVCRVADGYMDVG